jgi:protein TonB
MTGRPPLTLSLVDREPRSSPTREDTSAAWAKWEELVGEANGLSFADPMERPHPKRLRWLGVSLVIQSALGATWMLASLTADDELPPPRVVETFLTAAPPAPAPPPPAAAATATGSAADRGARSLPAGPRLAELAPAIMPATIAPEMSFGFDSGFAKGVDAGVPGGVIGGLVGGLPAAPAPPEIDAAPTIYVVSGELRPPDKLVHVDPVYPAIATAARVEGIVILEAVIDRDGNVDELRVLRSIPLLDEAAIEAVRCWKYEPTFIAGKPVPIQMTVTVRFALA